MNWPILRRTGIAIGAVALVACAYLLYCRLWQTPALTLTDTNGTASGADTDWFRTPGQVGGIEVYGAQDLLYQDRDPNGRILREIGFKEVWHQGRGNWAVNAPRVRLHLRDAECLITAASGNFRLQSSSTRAFVRDGSLAGDVTITLTPSAQGSIPPCQMQLDDLSISEDRPGFGSDGQVLFTCPQGRWKGRQMEVTYNQLTQRLQRLWIGRLEGLTWRLDRRQTAAPDSQPNPDRSGPGPSYQCLLQDRVTLRSGENIVYALGYLHIVDIEWSKKRDSVHAAAGPPHLGTSTSTGQLEVRCDGPVVVCPMDLALEVPQARDLDPNEPSVQEQADNRLIAAYLRYNSKTGDAVAGGPVWIWFRATDPLDPCSPDRQMLPVTITASERALYQASLGRLTLEGHCRCVMVRRGPGQLSTYSLGCERLVGQLDQRALGTDLSGVQRLKALQAQNGSVELRVESYDPQAGDVQGPLVAGARMICQELDWDSQSEVITATGPGTLWLNNASANKAGRSLLGQPYYALVRDFAVARLHVAQDQVVAEGGDRPILVDYFPINGTRQDLHIRAEATNVQVQLVRDQSGQFELGGLVATGKVFYDDQENRFSGHSLVYDHKTGWMEMSGKEGQPCTANGLSVLGIRFNLKTGQLQTTIVAPGMWLAQ